MEFISVRDFRTAPKDVWERLNRQGELVITNNGKPTALLLDLTGGDFEEILASVRQAKAMRAFNLMRQIAAGGEALSEEEIEAEIRAARAEQTP